MACREHGSDAATARKQVGGSGCQCVERKALCTKAHVTPQRARKIKSACVRFQQIDAKSIDSHRAYARASISDSARKLLHGSISMREHKHACTLRQSVAKITRQFRSLESLTTPRRSFYEHIGLIRSQKGTRHGKTHEMNGLNLAEYSISCS
jgi:hypothetical protein